MSKEAYITVEKIESGFLLIDPRGKKHHKNTLNGVADYLSKFFETKIILPDDHKPVKARKAKKDE